MSATITADAQRSGAGATAGASQDPIRELVLRMNEMRHLAAAIDSRLKGRIEALAEDLAKPGITGNSEFRSQAAYALQDLSRIAGPVVGMPASLKAEMDRLALSAPDLQSSRIQGMMRETPGINDARLVQDIRRLATEVGKAGGDQNRPEVLDQVEALEARIRARGPGPTRGAAAATDAGSQAPAAAAASGVPPAMGTAATTAPGAPAATGTAAAQRTDEHNGNKVQATASPGEGGMPAGRQATATNGGQVVQGAHIAKQSAAPPAGEEIGGGAGNRGPGVLVRLVGAMAPPGAGETQPWQPQPTPLGERIAAFVGRHNDEQSIKKAEASGQKAVEALRGFSEGPGAAIMARIQEAARSEPGGMQAVLSEMRTGGKHAELRTQFDSAMVREQGLATAYDAATSALRQYGTDRQAAEAALLKRPNQGVVAAGFEKLDAQIGEAAAKTPGRQEGRSAIEELGERVAEMARRAGEAIRNAFRPDARAERPSAGSSPSPGA